MQRGLGGFPHERLHQDNAHDYNFGDKMMSKLPENGVGVMDRGLAGLNFIEKKVSASR